MSSGIVMLRIAIIFSDGRCNRLMQFKIAGVTGAQAKVSQELFELRPLNSPCFLQVISPHPSAVPFLVHDKVAATSPSRRSFSESVISTVTVAMIPPLAELCAHTILVSV